MTQEALRMALEALETPSPMGQYKAITAIKEALAQTQEPVAIVDANDDGYWADILPNISVKVGQMLYANPPQRTEQEPVAKYSDIVSDGGLDPRNKFYVPPQRKPLTDEEIEQCCYEADSRANDHPQTFKWTVEFARAIEAAHGIKENT